MEALWLINHSSGREASAESPVLAFRQQEDYIKHIFWVLLRGPLIINPPVIPFHLQQAKRVKGSRCKLSIVHLFLCKKAPPGGNRKGPSIQNHIFDNKQHSGESQQCPKVRCLLFITLEAWQCTVSLEEKKKYHCHSSQKVSFHIWTKTAWEKNIIILYKTEKKQMSWERVQFHCKGVCIGKNTTIFKCRKNVGEKTSVSMVTTIVKTSAGAPWLCDNETPRTFCHFKIDTPFCKILLQLYREREREKGGVKAQSSSPKLKCSPTRLNFLHTIP